MPSFGLKVPLAEYEKQLLDDFVATFGSGSRDHTIKDPAIVTKVFERWRWASLLCESWNNLLEFDLPTSHEYDHVQLWESWLQQLSVTKAMCDGPGYIKVQDLRNCNPKYPQDFRIDRNSDLTVNFLPADFEYWRIISNVFLAVRYNIRCFSNPDILEDIYRKQELRPTEFDVPLAPDGNIHSVALLHAQNHVLALENHRVVEQVEAEILLRSTGGEQVSAEDEPVMQDGNSEASEHKMGWKRDEFDIWSLLRQAAMLERGGRQADKIWHALEDCRYRELYMLASTDYGSATIPDGPRLTLLDYQFSVSDPSTYIEFIPMSNLKMFSPPQTMSPLRPSIRLAIWHPVKASRFDHLMYTSEATYRYLVELNLTWPNHMDAGGVIFTLQPLKNSVFIQKLDDNVSGFWKSWNDCAITQNTSTNEWLLLQTIPGSTFNRVAAESSNLGDARKHFSLIMDRLRFGEPEKLHQFLELGNPLESEQLVDIIPYQQLISVDQAPIGEGAHGTVYKAIWACPGMTDTSGPRQIAVALKAMKINNSDHMKLFFQELDANLKLLVGEHIGGMRFYGVSKTQSPCSSGSETTESKLFRHLTGNTPLLVSEYATNGTMSQHLDNVLEGVFGDWNTMVYMMWMLTSYLYKYHQKNFVHRDLAMRNILVHMENKNDSDKDPKLAAVKISDLGRSVHLPDPLAQLSYTGEQHLPLRQVTDQFQLSKISDVRSLGNIFASMVTKVCEVLHQKTGNNSGLAPLCVVDWIQWCAETTEPQLIDLVLRMDLVILEIGANNKFLMRQMAEVNPLSLFTLQSETGSSADKPRSSISK